MRKLFGALVVSGVVFGSSACGLGGDSAEEAACKSIKKELNGVSSGGAAVTAGGGAAASAPQFTDAAAKIRAEGKKAGGTVEAAAATFAKDLDDTAAMLRRLGSGNVTGSAPDLPRIQRNANALAKACGFTDFRFGS